MSNTTPKKNIPDRKQEQQTPAKEDLSESLNRNFSDSNRNCGFIAKQVEPDVKKPTKSSDGSGK